jgi:hypothetical protein
MSTISSLLRQETAVAAGLSDVFDEEPAPLDVFIKDKKYLYNPPLSEVQYEAVRHLEQIYYRQTYVDMVEQFGEYWRPVRFITEATLQWGKGSGKDHICRVAAARVAYLLLCLKNPQAYFGIPPQDSIHMLNVASSAPQASRAFFEPLRRLLTRKGCWFEDKCHDREQSIVFHKNLEAISGHSSAETQEGLNLICGIADEISAFRTREEAEKFARGPREAANTAEAIMSMMRTSASTRFPDGNYKIAAISFPRFRGDAIQQLTKDANKSIARDGQQSRRYVSGPLKTWEVNPRVRGKDQFQDEYDKDPDAAKAKYECDPPASANTFFRNKDRVREAMSREVSAPPVSIDYIWRENEHGVGEWWPEFSFSDDLQPIDGAIYAMHGDIGITQDKAGVAMCHVSTWDVREWTVGHNEDGTEIKQTDSRPTVRLDIATSFEADLAAQPAPRQVQIAWYRELLMELQRRGFCILLYTFDGYQSTDGMQQLERMGIESRRVSTDSKDAIHWKTLRDLIYQGRFDGYQQEDVTNELLLLTRTTSGKVDHPSFGSKDEADALCLATIGALDMGGRESEERTVAQPAGLSMPEALGSDLLPDSLFETAEAFLGD